MFISIDAGKYATKAISQNRSVYFRTKIEESEPDAKPTTQSSYHIQYDNKSYLIGDEAAISDYDTTKAKLSHKLAIYTAIALMIEKFEEVTIAIGCPLSEFLNSSSRENYKNFISDGSIVKIKINGKDKLFRIKQVYVFPESIGLIYQNTNEHKDKLVAIIDIGGLNTNGAIYDRLKPIKSSAFTINEGANIIMNKIKKDLNSKLSRNYQDYEIPYVINSEDKEVRKIVDEVIHDHLTVIIQETKKNNWNFQVMQIIFTGGGSNMLQNAIKEIPNAKISENAVWDNATGFYKVGELLG